MTDQHQKASRRITKKLKKVVFFVILGFGDRNPTGIMA